MAIKGSELIGARRKVTVRFCFVLGGIQRDEDFTFTHRQISLALRDKWRDEERASADDSRARRAEIEQKRSLLGKAAEGEATGDLEAEITKLEREDEDAERGFLARRLASVELSSPDITEEDNVTPAKLDADYLRQLDLGWLRAIMAAITEGTFQKKATT